MNNKTRLHHKVILMVACIFSIFIYACVKKPIEKTHLSTGNSSVTKEIFITDPFGYKPTIKNFTTNLFPQFKLQVYSIKNIHNPAVSDTIYRFYRKKSELFLYKTTDGKELFFAGNIFDSKVVFKNGVKVGIPKNDFFKSFTNLIPTLNDTIIIASKRATTLFKFIFKKDKLQVIKIDNYID